MAARAELGVAGPLVIVGAIAYLLAVHGQEIEQAVKRISFSELVLVTLLAFITLLARTEAVVACLYPRWRTVPVGSTPLS